MRIECPQCLTSCAVDRETTDSATCPHCGLSFSTDRSTPGNQSKGTDSQLPGSQASVPPDSPGLETHPTHLGDFEIRRVIAEGGFARVYLAYDEKLDREVAIKVPRKERFLSAADFAAFMTEARTAAKLMHPGVVQIFEVDTSEDGTCYIVMEYVKGHSLAHYLKVEPGSPAALTPLRAAEIVESVAETIHYAHKSGFIHRDLTPSNILIDESGRVRVADFGLAVHEDDQYLFARELAGTLPYMSPEQLRGEVDRLDGRCDIWSLGVILYEMLARRRPFAGRRKQLRQEILDRNAKPLRQLNEAVPIELEQICQRCLAKQPAGRYSSAHDLAEDLRAWRNKAHPSISAMGEAVWQRRWTGVGLAGALSVVVISALAGTPELFKPDTASRSGARAQTSAPPAIDVSIPSVPASTEVTSDDFALLSGKVRSTDSLVAEKWHSLFDVMPTPLLARMSEAEVVHRPKSFYVSIKAQDAPRTLLVVGSTTAKTYDLKTSIALKSPLGSAGIFFGAQRLESPDNDLWQIHKVDLQRRQNRCVISYSLHPYRYVNGAWKQLKPAYHKQVEIEEPDDSARVLRVNYDNNRLKSVIWHGELIEDFLPAHLADLPPNAFGVPVGESAFGILGNSSYAVFRDFQYRKHNR